MFDELLSIVQPQNYCRRSYFAIASILCLALLISIPADSLENDKSVQVILGNSLTDSIKVLDSLRGNLCQFDHGVTEDAKWKCEIGPDGNCHCHSVQE